LPLFDSGEIMTLIMINPVITLTYFRIASGVSIEATALKMVVSLMVKRVLHSGRRRFLRSICVVSIS
ncbi:MAG: hypothetical protein IKT75_08645, partial [Alistipes sp.]|nr:hypothetical protein [Alistipes sp.]